MPSWLVNLCRPKNSLRASSPFERVMRSHATAALKRKHEWKWFVVSVILVGLVTRHSRPWTSSKLCIIFPSLYYELLWQWQPRDNFIQLILQSNIVVSTWSFGWPIKAKYYYFLFSKGWFSSYGLNCTIRLSSLEGNNEAKYTTMPPPPFLRSFLYIPFTANWLFGKDLSIFVSV